MENMTGAGRIIGDRFPGYLIYRRSNNLGGKSAALIAYTGEVTHIACAAVTATTLSGFLLWQVGQRFGIPV